MPRNPALHVVDRLRVASPCDASWDSMRGDDRVRHCSRCNLSVHNIAAMTSDEAAALIAASPGRLCARLYRRADGTVITADCPVGRARLRERAARLVLRGAAVMFAIYSASALGGHRPRAELNLEEVEPFASLCRWVRPPSPPSPPSLTPLTFPPARGVMGDIRCGTLDGRSGGT